MQKYSLAKLFHSLTEVCKISPEFLHSFGKHVHLLAKAVPGKARVTFGSSQKGSFELVSDVSMCSMLPSPRGFRVYKRSDDSFLSTIPVRHPGPRTL